jgi:hypothetical protein
MNMGNEDWQMIAEDPRLGWAARGLLLWLVSRHDAGICISRLIKETERSARPAKRDAVYKTINELIESGYIRRQQRRTEKGRMSGVDYAVFVKPLPSNDEVTA